MDKWPRTISYCSRLEIIQYCVNDYSWQKFRLSLKGQTTETKLNRLFDWLMSKGTRDAEVQVDNYLGALKRGGQISADGTVLK